MDIVDVGCGFGVVVGRVVGLGWCVLGCCVIVLMVWVSLCVVGVVKRFRSGWLWRGGP